MSGRNPRRLREVITWCAKSLRMTGRTLKLSTTKTLMLCWLPDKQSGVKTDLAALQCLGRVGRGDGGVELVLRFAQQGDHFTVGVVAVLHHLVRLHRLVQNVAEVASL